jgi:threonine/homoserine/homoserine lactone efflux protein
VHVLVGAALLALVLAVQVGPVTLLMVRSTLRGSAAIGLAMAVGVSLVDLLYATLGLAGLSQFARSSVVQLGLGAFGAASLAVIGARTLWLGLRARVGAETGTEVDAVGRAFTTAVAATALNPLTMLLWIVSFPAALSSQLDGSLRDDVLVLGGSTAGTLAWYCSLAVAVAFAGRWLATGLLRCIDVAVGAGLLAFGGILGYRVASDA